MSLADAVAGAAKAAMGAISSLTTTADIYMQSGDPVYDSATGTYTESTVSDSGVQVLLYDFEADEIISNLRFQTDQKALIESLHLVSVTQPEWFVIDGVRWDVISPMRVPGDSIRMFHLRNTGESA